MNNWVEFWLHSGGLKVLVQGNGFIPIQNSSPKMVFYRSNPNQAVTAYYGVGHLFLYILLSAKFMFGKNIRKVLTCVFVGFRNVWS